MSVNGACISGGLVGFCTCSYVHTESAMISGEGKKRGREIYNNAVTENMIMLFPQFVIVVIDSTDRERLAVTREELYRMLAHDELSKAAVLIYANKQDLKGSMSAAEISKQLDLTSIKKHQWHIQSCCALTGEG